MHQAPDKQLLSLLVHAYNNFIKDFYYFPDVIFIGEQKISKEEFDLLLSKAFIEEYHHDSFGRFYKLSQKGEYFIYEMLILKRPHKKRKPVQEMSQGCLSF